MDYFWPFQRVLSRARDRIGQRFWPKFGSVPYSDVAAFVFFLFLAVGTGEFVMARLDLPPGVLTAGTTITAFGSVEENSPPDSEFSSVTATPPWMAPLPKEPTQDALIRLDSGEALRAFRATRKYFLKKASLRSAPTHTPARERTASVDTRSRPKAPPTLDQKGEEPAEEENSPEGGASGAVDDRLAAVFSSLDVRDMLKGIWETFHQNRIRVGGAVFRWNQDRDVVDIDSVPGMVKRESEERKANGSGPIKEIHTLAMLNGKITGSLYQSILRAGGDGALAMELADVFSWHVDFRTDLRRGDDFAIVAESWVTGRSKARWGRVLAARLEVSGEAFSAVGFPMKDGELRYYDAEGNALHKAFLKSPLKYTRISSGYSNRRFHPILKVNRPHRGVDYAAPYGTPVRAVADGMVSMARWMGEGGRTVEIRHSNRLKTRYHHLSKYARGIRVGRRVSQGDIIGFVGSSGLATGPHLDFRLFQNGRPVNPQKVKQPPGKPVPADERERFFRVRDALFAPIQAVNRRFRTQIDNPVVTAKTARP